MGVTELIPEKGGAGGFRAAMEAVQKKVTNVNIYQLIGNALSEKLRHLSSATLMQRQEATLKFMKDEAPKIYEMYAEKPNFSGTVLDLSIEEGTAELFKGVMAQKALGPLRQQIVPKLNGKGNAGRALDDLLYARPELSEAKQKELWLLIQSGSVDIEGTLSRGEIEAGKRVTERAMAGEILGEEELSKGYLYLRAALRTSSSEAQTDKIIRNLGEHAKILDSAMAFGLSGSLEVPRFGIKGLASETVQEVAATRISQFYLIAARAYAALKFRKFKGEEKTIKVSEFMKELEDKYLTDEARTIGSVSRGFKGGIKRHPGIALAVGLAAAFGIGYGVYSLVSDDEAKVKTGKAVPVIITEAKPITGIDNSLTKVEGVGRRANRVCILRGAGEEAARQITSQVRLMIPDPKEQGQMFTMIRAMIGEKGDTEFGQALRDKSFIAGMPLLIAALYNLQKIGAPPEALAPIAVRLALDYIPNAYKPVSLALEYQKIQNPRANLLTAVQDPKMLLRSAGKPEEKYLALMSERWKETPLPAFKDFFVETTGGNVRKLSAAIRKSFPESEWNEVANGLAGYYAAQKKGKSPVVTEVYQSHVSFLVQERKNGFSTADSVMLLKEASGKGFSTDDLSSLMKGAKANGFTLQDLIKIMREAGWKGFSSEGIVNLMKAAKSKGFSMDDLVGLMGLGDTNKGFDQEKFLTSLLAKINKKTPQEEVEARARLLKQPDILPLLEILDKPDSKMTELQKEQVIYRIAGKPERGGRVGGYFKPEFQKRVLKGDLPPQEVPEDAEAVPVAGAIPISERIKPGMDMADTAQEIHAIGFNVPRDWTTEKWDTVLDPQIYRYFDADGNSRNKGGLVARMQHKALTYKQYKEERDLLIAFIDGWKAENLIETPDPEFVLQKAKQVFLIEREKATRNLPYEDKLKRMHKNIDKRELDARVKSIESGAGEKKEEPKRRRHRRHHRHR